MEKKLYIISQYSGATEAEIYKHVRVARCAARDAYLLGYFPVVPHIYCTQYLRDDVQEEREAGLQIGINLLKQCHKAKVWIVDGVISSGMAAEIEYCKEHNIQLEEVHLNSEMLDTMERNLFTRGSKDEY